MAVSTVSQPLIDDIGAEYGLKARDLWRRAAALLFTALATFAILAGIQKIAALSIFTYEIQMTVSRPGSDPVSVSVTGDQEHTLSIPPNQRSKLTVTDTALRTQLVAVAISGPGCSTVTFHDVSLLRNDRTPIFTYGPGELARLWGLHDSLLPEKPGATSEGVSFETCGNPEAFRIAARLSSGPLCDSCAALVEFFNPSAAREFFLLAVEALLLAFLLTQLLHHRDVSLLLILGSYGVLVAAAFFCHKYLTLPDSIDVAVGMAGFTGGSTFANISAIVSAAGASALLGAASGYGQRRFGGRLPFSSDIEDGARQTQRPRGLLFPARAFWRLAIGAAVLISCAAYLAAPLIDRIVSSPRDYSPGWDANNILLWAYLSHEGLRPFKDFWYAYGGQWLFALPAPWGESFSFAVLLLNYALIYFSLNRLLPRAWIWPAAATLLLIAFDVAGVTPNLYRYIMSVNIALCHAALMLERREPWTSIAFFSAVLIALLIEPAQLLYAAPALAYTKIAGAVVRDGSPSPFWRGDHRDVLVGLAASAIFAAYLAVDGSLKSFIQFYLALGGQAAFGSMPTDMATPLTQWTSINLIILVAPAALLAISVYRVFCSTGRQRRIAVAIGALGLVGLMVVQKHLIRPIEWQALLPAIVALVLLIGSRARVGQTLEVAGAGLAAGLLAFGLWNSGLAAQMEGQALKGLQSAITLTSDELLAKSVMQRNERYAPARFAQFKDELAILEELRANSADGRLPVFYAVGDTPLLYLLARQAPPYHSVDYDASPISEQWTVVDWLRRRDPQIAVWRYGDLTFDYLQRTARVPLIYDEVVDMFAPLKDVGPFALLRRRRPDEAVPLAWWRERLGSQFYFGWLLRASKPDPACEPGASEECQEVAELTIDPSSTDPAGAVPSAFVNVEVDGLAFTIVVVLDKNYRYYRIPLHRIWFWNAAERHGLPRRIVSVNSNVAMPMDLKIGHQAAGKHLY